MNDRAPPSRHAYRWFAGGAASWFFGWSIQGVVFTWLVLADTHAAAGTLGSVQTVLALPRREPERWDVRYTLNQSAEETRWVTEVLGLTPAASA